MYVNVTTWFCTRRIWAAKETNGWMKSYLALSFWGVWDIPWFGNPHWTYPGMDGWMDWWMLDRWMNLNLWSLCHSLLFWELSYAILTFQYVFQLLVCIALMDQNPAFELVDTRWAPTIVVNEVISPRILEKWPFQQMGFTGLISPGNKWSCGPLTYSDRLGARLVVLFFVFNLKSVAPYGCFQK